MRHGGNVSRNAPNNQGHVATNAEKSESPNRLKYTSEPITQSAISNLNMLETTPLVQANTLHSHSARKFIYHGIIQTTDMPINACLSAKF